MLKASQEGALLAGNACVSALCLAGFLMLASTCATAASPIEISKSLGAPDATFSWLDCGYTELQPAIKIDVWKDGTGRYAASPFIREAKEEVSKIASPAVLKLLDAAGKLAASSRVELTLPASRDDLRLDEEFCLATTMREGGTERRGMARLDKPGGMRQPIATVNAILHPTKRACPLRDTGLELAIGRAGFCDRELIGVAVPETSACYSYRSIYVFKDGTVKAGGEQVIPQVGRRARRVYLENSFSKVDAVTLAHLLAIAVSFEAGEPLILHGPEHPAVVDRGTAIDHKAFANAVYEAARIQPVEIPTESDCAGDRGMAISRLWTVDLPNQ
jgi:hypothetical protein